MSPDPADPATATPPTPGRLRVNSPAARAALYYGFVALLCLGCVYGVLGLRNFNPRDPFEYSGDSLLHAMAIKAISEHGWYQHIDRLAAPGGLRLEDFPMCDNLCCAVIWVLARFTSNPFLIQGVFYLGLFPVTAVVAAWTLRHFGRSAGSSLLGGMLYALLPYHFARGTGHLFLTAYFLVPPVCLVLWWNMRGALLAPPGGEENRSEARVRRRRLLGGVGVCALMGCNAVYYPFFSCVLFGVAGLYALAVRRNWRHGALAFLLAGLIGALVVANLLPTILYARQNGPSAAGQRFPYEAEYYGLKLAQLVLPVTYHRVHALATLKTTYNEAPLVNENDHSTLGMVGTAGLLLLLAWAVLASRGLRSSPPGQGGNAGLAAILEPISVLNVAAILFGTVGGFSSLFALLVSPQLRAYNRISVFIAFLSLLAVAAALDHLVWRRLRSPAARAAFFVGTLALAGFGVWDQTTPEFIRHYHRSRHDYLDAARYFAQIEATLPPGAMVFQLPAIAFPEAERSIVWQAYNAEVKDISEIDPVTGR